MKQIHNGGPNPGGCLPDLTDQEISEILDYELLSNALEYWPVYIIRSPKPRPDSKIKTEPFEWVNLQELVVS